MESEQELHFTVPFIGMLVLLYAFADFLPLVVWTIVWLAIQIKFLEEKHA